MFSNLSQNSILYVLDINGTPKILSGPIERVTMPRPKYNSFNPNMEMVVDIVATLNGERREFKGVPNGSIADFGNDSFVLAENKDTLNSYINAMLLCGRAGGYILYHMILSPPFSQRYADPPVFCRILAKTCLSDWCDTMLPTANPPQKLH